MERRAALAIRDNVTPFQKWGSRQFTWSCLNAGYDAVWYFTQTAADSSREAFLAQLEQALECYPAVDLYLLAHHNNYADWVAQVPAGARSHLPPSACRLGPSGLMDCSFAPARQPPCC